MKKDSVTILLDGHRKPQRIRSSKSLLALYKHLGRDFVQIVGMCDYPVKVVSLSPDLLNAHVLAYRIDSYLTFTVVLKLVGGFAPWEGW